MQTSPAKVCRCKLPQRLGSKRRAQENCKEFRQDFVDIKRLFNFPTINTVKMPSKTERVAKFDSADDRDANGQEGYQKQKEKQQHEPMTDEQIEKALAELRAHAAVKEHNWQVHLETVEGKRFVLIKDNMGNLIRRIPEAELWSLNFSAEPGKGQFLKRTA